MKIGILTCNKCTELSPRDQHLLPLFEAKQVQAEILVWDDPAVDWSAYDGLLFRSVWDYHLRPVEFNHWLDMIMHKGIKTLNPIEIVLQNQHKFYLRDLERRGVDIVPTVFIERTDRLNISIVHSKNWQQAVIKPAVSASSYLTTLFDGRDWHQVQEQYHEVAKERELLLQPFMPEVLAMGEVSLIFFNRRYSHAVLKKAVQGEFRVQAEFGGSHVAFEPDDSVIETAEIIISLIPGELLYARVDGLIQNAVFVLMELELLEPDLYFDAHPQASDRYVKGVIELLS